VKPSADAMNAAIPAASIAYSGQWVLRLWEESEHRAAWIDQGSDR
jgi:hypothetical protein